MKSSRKLFILRSLLEPNLMALHDSHTSDITRKQPLCLFFVFVKPFRHKFFYLLQFISKVFSSRGWSLWEHLSLFFCEIIFSSIQKVVEWVSAKTSQITKPLGKWKDFCFTETFERFRGMKVFLLLLLCRAFRNKPLLNLFRLFFLIFFLNAQDNIFVINHLPRPSNKQEPTAPSTSSLMMLLVNK